MIFNNPKEKLFNIYCGTQFLMFEWAHTAEEACRKAAIPTGRVAEILRAVEHRQ